MGYTAFEVWLMELGVLTITDDPSPADPREETNDTIAPLRESV